MTYEHSRVRLAEIGQLEADWDGYGADPVRPDAIKAANDFINVLEDRALPPPDDVYALCDGNCILEWRGEDKVYKRVEVSGMDYQVMITFPDRNATFIVVDDVEKAIARLENKNGPDIHPPDPRQEENQVLPGVS